MKRLLIGLIAALLLTGCDAMVTNPGAPTTDPQPAPPVAAPPTATVPPASSTAPCRTEPLAAVYHPQRLQILNPCKTVTGTVAHIIHEQDGDDHIRVTLDAPYANLINDKNRTAQHGDLVVEIIPADRDELQEPHVGQHIQITGAYALDHEHGWMEIHPVWRITDLATGKTQDAPPPTACEIQHPEERGACAATSSAPASDPGTVTLTTTTTVSRAASTSGITFAYVASPVSRGSYGDVRVTTAPGTSCGITVEYASGPSKAQGLGPETAGANGNVEWSWKIGTRTTPGTWPIIATCGGQTARTSFVVQ